MANFEKNGQNVHGTVVTAKTGQTFEIGLWGPVDTRNGNELDVVLNPPKSGVSIKPDRLVDNVRFWKFTGLPAGLHMIEAKDGGGATWTQVTVSVSAAASLGTTVTRDSLLDKAGVVQARWPPSPAIQALIALLTRGTDSGLRAGVASLESAGRSGTLYEHTAGLALDIYRDSTDAAQRLQAHNLIRFFIGYRRTLGWRNMFYEGWGFSQLGTMGGAPNHHNHIHIDWLDFSKIKFNGSNKHDRSQWTEITWPPEAFNGPAVNSDNNAAQVRAAWNNTAAAALTDGDLAGLY